MIGGTDLDDDVGGRWVAVPVSSGGGTGTASALTTVVRARRGCDQFVQLIPKRESDAKPEYGRCLGPDDDGDVVDPWATVAMLRRPLAEVEVATCCSLG